jgi:hypothetical protein
MEILFRSVARAGGIEVPPEVRIFEPRESKPREHRLSTKLAGALHGLAQFLDRSAGRLAADAAPGHGRTTAHP